MGYHLSPKPAFKGQITVPTERVKFYETYVPQTQKHTDTASKRVIDRGEALQRRGETLKSILEVTEIVSDDTLSVDSLKQLLDTLSIEAKFYQFEVLRYQGLVDTLLLTHNDERNAYLKQTEALQAVLREAENRARCTTFGIPCPTRWQAFALGVGVAATILVLR